MRGDTLRTGVLAGIAGGAAEMVWVAGYGAVTGTPVGAVARGVATAVWPSLGTSNLVAVAGMALHMVLAAGLGIIVVAALRAPILRRAGTWSRSALVVLALGAVWAT